MRTRLLFAAASALLGGSAIFVPAQLKAAGVSVGVRSCGADCLYSCCYAGGLGCTCTCDFSGLGRCYCFWTF
jgi:hypothetical protein